MPRLNRIGDVCAGRGLSIVSVNGLVAARGGSTSWIDNETVVFQTAQNTIGSYPKGGGLITELDLQGAQPVWAGGGIWAAWLGIHGRVRDSLKRDYPAGSGLWGVSRDAGSVLYVRDRQAGRGLVIRYRDGHEVSVDAQNISHARYEDGILVWTDGLTLHTPSGRVATHEAVFGPVPVILQSGPHVLYHTHDRLVLQPIGDPDHGWVLQDRPGTFNPDIVRLATGRVVVTWATSEGEIPEHVVVRDVDMKQPYVSLRRVVVPVPQPPEPPPVPREEPMYLSEEQKRVVSLMYARVVDLHKGSDEQRRQATLMTLQQLKHSFPADGFCAKSQHRDLSSTSKDALARVVNGKLYSLDHIDGATRELRIDGPFEELVGQYPVPVSPVDHLGLDTPVVTPPPVEEPTEPTTPPTPPQPRVDLTPILAELTALRLEVEAQAEALRACRDSIEAVRLSVLDVVQGRAKVRITF